MTPKEIRAALADDDMQAAVDKIVAKAVKDETKRCSQILKDYPADETAAPKTVKQVLKELRDEIKAPF